MLFCLGISIAFIRLLGYLEDRELLIILSIGAVLALIRRYAQDPEGFWTMVSSAPKWMWIETKALAKSKWFLLVLLYVPLALVYGAFVVVCGLVCVVFRLIFEAGGLLFAPLIRCGQALVNRCCRRPPEPQHNVVN